MEARIGGEAHLYYASVASSVLPTVGRSSFEWDPSDWKWDGDLFIATPLNRCPSSYQSRQFFPIETGVTTAGTSSNSSSRCSDELHHEIVKDKRELERKRRANAVDDHNLGDDTAGSLTLKLGGRGYAVANGDRVAGKKTKLAGSAPNRAVCQVENCGVDLIKAKEYHRRHKVCEMHSKASKAFVGNQMQRFCQQCSRFHALQEFDEGKRSCRRRLAGHNKRRRKMQPENVSNNSSANDNQSNSYLLMSILRILSSMHSTRSNYVIDQDILPHLFRGLTNHGSFHWEKEASRYLQEYQNLLNNLPSLGSSEFVAEFLSNRSFERPRLQHLASPNAQIVCTDGNLPASSSQRPEIMLPIQSSSQAYKQDRETSGQMSKINNFDLNDVYIDSDDGVNDLERSTGPVGLVTHLNESPSWVQQQFDQSSPPETSGHSDSASAHSPSTSSEDIQSRTDRIVFKLFGKEPRDFPIILRAQIFDWLSHSPTDIESYIRPGCVILTIYLRLSESTWDELCCDLSSSLSRLVDLSDDVNFWSTGWIYVRVLNQIAFINNGQVVVDTSLPFGTDNYCTMILSVKPVAVTSSEPAQFVIKGFNLSGSSTRLLCALEGNYLEADGESLEHVDSPDRAKLQCLSLSYSIPAVIGRGFIEVEDHGLSSIFFPFIVAEDDVCTEIRMLENEIELANRNDLQQGSDRCNTRNHAMEFINEMGWLLHKHQARFRFGHEDPSLFLFPFERFKYLVEFSMDRGWCAVVTKLLDILFCGIVRGGEQPFLKFALTEMGLLHRAVRRNSRSLVEMLLTYVPQNVTEDRMLEYKSLVGIDRSFLFRPDAAGPGGLTPLHVAAGRDGSEDTLDALTDDPAKVGIGAWKSALDSTGSTPEDYARLRGHYSYIHLVRRKINKKVSYGHVVVDISDTVSDSSIARKSNGCQATSFEIGRSQSQVECSQRPCGVCDQKTGSRTGGQILVYRPTMLSMLAIAAVCVCVALLFKSSPHVLFVFRPFSWEMLEYGSS